MNCKDNLDAGINFVSEAVRKGYKRIAVLLPEGLIPELLTDLIIEKSTGDGGYNPSKYCLSLNNGSKITFYTVSNPSRLFGQEHDAFWVNVPMCDKGFDELWLNLMSSLRLFSFRNQTISSMGLCSFYIGLDQYIPILYCEDDLKNMFKTKTPYYERVFSHLKNKNGSEVLPGEEIPISVYNEETGDFEIKR